MAGLKDWNDRKEELKSVCDMLYRSAAEIFGEYLDRVYFSAAKERKGADEQGDMLMTVVLKKGSEPEMTKYLLSDIVDIELEYGVVIDIDIIEDAVTYM